MSSSQTRPSTAAARDPARQIAEALWRLLVSGKPRFPMIAAEFGLTPPQLHLMRLLREQEALPMGQIAELLFCDASNVTAIVDRLEERGLIERHPNPEDRRVKLIAATGAGRELQTQAFARLFEPPPGIVALPAADQRALRDLLAKAAELQRDVTWE